MLWDVRARIGSDYNSLYLGSEGTRLIHEDKFEEAERSARPRTWLSPTVKIWRFFSFGAGLKVWF